MSKEGETVELRTPVAATGPAETWLAELVESMRETMRWEARRAAKEVHRTPIEDFVWSRPAQMALLGLQVKWTADVQSALYQASLGKKGSRCKRSLGEYEATLSKPGRAHAVQRPVARAADVAGDVHHDISSTRRTS